MNNEIGKPEKRMAENYEIISAFWVGDKEIVFGIDENDSEPYLCAFYNSHIILGQYSECMVGNDYIGMVELFSQRIQEQCNKVRDEQAKVRVPRIAITPDMCYKNDYSKSIEGKVVVIKADSLRPEYRTADRQLMLCTGGFGSHANARGNACFCINLYSGKDTRWERYDIQGEIKPEYMPDWAKERLEIIRKGETNKVKAYVKNNDIAER